MKAEREAYNEQRKLLLLKHFKKAQTINDVIQTIFEKDVREGTAIAKGWRYYVHLNKFPSQLKTEKRLAHVGEDSKGEKLWRTL